MKRSWTLGALGLALAACGGGGGGGGGGFVEPAGFVAAISTSTFGGDADLFVVDNTTTEAPPLVGPVANPDFQIAFGSIVWNPAKTRVVFVGDPEVQNSKHLLLADPAAQTVTDLTPAAPSPNFFGAEPQWSDDGAFVAFIATLETANVFDLYVVPVAGGAPLRVDFGVTATSPDRDVFQFQWKPGSHRLAFIGDMDVDEQIDLYVVDADGSNLVRAARPGATGADIVDFKWSDDGVRLAFLSNLANGNNSVFLYSVLDDGTGLVPVSSQLAGHTVSAYRWQPGPANGLAFSIGAVGPDEEFTLIRGFVATGAQVVIATVGRVGNAGDQFFKFAAGGSLVYEVRREVPTLQCSLRINSGAFVDSVLEDFPSDTGRFGVVGLEVSPDLERIGYKVAVDPLRDSEDLFVIKPDGSDKRRVNGLFPLLPDGGYVDYFAFSPDSSRIAFSTRIYPDEPDDVFVVPAASGSPVLISTETEDMESLAWTSNSAFVIFEKTNGLVFLAAADGSFTRLLSAAVPSDPEQIVPR